MLAVLICLIGVLLTIYCLLTRNYEYWSSRRVSHAKPFLIFGSLFDAFTGKEHLNDTLINLYRQFNGPYFGMYMLNKPVLVVKDPALVKKIMLSDFDHFRNRQGSADEHTDPIAFNTLFSAKDDVWKQLRSKMSPVFSSGKLKMMFPLMRECGEQFEEFLDRYDGQVVDMRMACKKFSVDVISSCAFGIQTNCMGRKENTDILTMSTRLLDPTSLVRGLSIFTFFFVPKLFKWLRLTFADQKATDYLLNVFHESYRERLNQNIERHDLIDYLNHLKNEEVKGADTFKFDDVKMAAQAIVFFSAGNDSTSIAVTYALYELALNRKISQRLREELRRYDEITYETVHELKYLDMVVSEALRKYPIGGFLNRNTNSAYHIEGTDFTLDKDTMILIPICGLHADDRYYPKPELFDPERFNEENRKNIVPFTYLPFGGGPRICIGQRFAIMMVKMALIYAIRNYDFEISDDTSIPLEYEKSSAVFLLPKNNELLLKVSRV